MKIWWDNKFPHEYGTSKIDAIDVLIAIDYYEDGSPRYISVYFGRSQVLVFEGNHSMFRMLKYGAEAHSGIKGFIEANIDKLMDVYVGKRKRIVYRSKS
jgi:hypothetical protein